jgi:hypothetical protein
MRGEGGVRLGRIVRDGGGGDVPMRRREPVLECAAREVVLHCVAQLPLVGGPPGARRVSFEAVSPALPGHAARGVGAGRHAPDPSSCRPLPRLLQQDCTNGSNDD